MYSTVVTLPILYLVTASCNSYTHSNQSRFGYRTCYNYSTIKHDLTHDTKCTAGKKAYPYGGIQLKLGWCLIILWCSIRLVYVVVL